MTKPASKFKPGKTFGHFKLLGRIRASKKLNQNLKVRWRVECVCGKQLIVPEYYMRRKPNPKLHCGCIGKSIKVTSKQEYGIWYMMHQRCQNPNHDAYHHYGGRGIKICDRWNKEVVGTNEGFKNFLEDVGARPSKKYSIDRIDNDGPYHPDNIRWATAKQQRANQRPRKSKS